MQTGPVFRFLLWVLYLFLVQAAPGQPGTQREGSLSAPGLLNPFGPGEGDRRLLQSYIQSHVKEEGGTGINSWEQEVFFLVRLHDYDRSGRLDGLELMTLISDFNTHTPGEHSSGQVQVVSLVDVLLQTLDLNQDGVLDPSELLVPPNTQEHNNNNNKEPQQEEQKEEEEVHEELQAHDEEQEVKTEDERSHPQHGLQIPESPAAEQEQHRAPVHQGQPDM